MISRKDLIYGGHDLVLDEERHRARYGNRTAGGGGLGGGGGGAMGGGPLPLLARLRKGIHKSVFGGGGSRRGSLSSVDPLQIEGRPSASPRAIRRAANEAVISAGGSGGHDCNGGGGPSTAALRSLDQPLLREGRGRSQSEQMLRPQSDAMLRPPAPATGLALPPSEVDAPALGAGQPPPPGFRRVGGGRGGSEMPSAT